MEPERVVWSPDGLMRISVGSVEEGPGWGERSWLELESRGWVPRLPWRSLPSGAASVEVVRAVHTHWVVVDLPPGEPGQGLLVPRGPWPMTSLRTLDSVPGSVWLRHVPALGVMGRQSTGEWIAEVGRLLAGAGWEITPGRVVEGVKVAVPVRRAVTDL